MFLRPLLAERNRQVLSGFLPQVTTSRLALAQTPDTGIDLDQSWPAQASLGPRPVVTDLSVL